MKNLTTIITAIFLLTSITTAQNYSLSFDGEDDYVEIADSDELDGMEQLTVQFWANLAEYSLDESKGINFVIKTEHPSDYISYSFYTAGDENMLTFRVRTTSGAAGANLFNYSDYVSLNEWHLLTGVYNGANIQLYIDGVLMVEDDLTGTVIQNDYPVSLANITNPSTTKNYYGKMDDLSIWATGLTQEEIQSNMYSELTGNEDGLIGYWNFNEGTGDVAYDQSGGNDGTIYGATWDEDGAPVDPPPPPPDYDNYSLSFDGVDDYANIVELSTAIDNSDITLMGWFKSTSNGDPNIYHEGIFGFRNYPSSNGNYFATMNWTGHSVPTIECYGGAPANIPLTPNDDTWYHLALVYDNTNAVFSTYLDGTQIASNTATNDPIVPSIDLLIGNNIENGNHFFQGYIDDISLWSTALSQENIQFYRSSELNGNETGLVGYWNFNEGIGTTAYDATSNDNDGTIYGATWSTDVP